MAAADFIAFTTPAGVGSPCILVCALDKATGWCRGCGRTGDEIATWSASDDAVRQAVLDALPARMAALERAGRQDQSGMTTG